MGSNVYKLLYGYCDCADTFYIRGHDSLHVFWGKKSGQIVLKIICRINFLISDGGIERNMVIESINQIEDDRGIDEDQARTWIRSFSSIPVLHSKICCSSEMLNVAPSSAISAPFFEEWDEFVWAASAAAMRV